MTSNGKISLRQAMMVFLVITFTPAVRVIPQSATQIAKQAGWLAPLFGFVLILPAIFALKNIYKKHPDKSFAALLEVVFGRFAGKAVTFVYVVFLQLLLTVNAGGISQKLVTSIYPNVNPMIFIIAMLLIVGFAVSKGGLTVITRMGEIMLPFLMVVFIILCLLSIPNIKLSRITPISTLDIVPVLKSSYAISSPQAHLPILFLLSNYINNIEKTGKYCISAALIYMLLVITLIITVVGSLGIETAQNTSLTLMTTVKLISLFDTIERIEPFVVGLWILTDFMIMSVLLISLLNMYKSLFHLSKTNNFVIVSLIIVFFLAMMLGRNAFETMRLVETFLPPAMFFWGFVLPIIVLTTGKVRKLL